MFDTPTYFSNLHQKKTVNRLVCEDVVGCNSEVIVKFGIDLDSRMTSFDGIQGKGTSSRLPVFAEETVHHK